MKRLVFNDEKLVLTTSDIAKVSKLLRIIIRIEFAYLSSADDETLIIFGEHHESMLMKYNGNLLRSRDGAKQLRIRIYFINADYSPWM